MTNNNKQPNKSYQYPPRHKEILAKMRHPDYEGNFLLPDNASLLDKTKYQICKQILRTVYYVSQKDNKKSSEEREKEQKSVDIQQLQTQLNSVKNELKKSNTGQKSQLEDKLSSIENKIKNLSSPDKPTIKKLEEEIKKVKEKLEENKPDKDKNDNPNPDRNDKPNDKDNPPKPNPQPDKNDKGFNYVSTKINDNTYKYKITLDVNVSQKTLDKPFEFVVIRSEDLNNATQNHKPFEDYLADAFLQNKYAISFPNKPATNQPSDAILVIPSQVATKLSEELAKGDRPRWLNTHGLGVSYLHVRIDESSRYYSNYKEYEK
ncbi:39484_t:CDS:2 [Gigaspora margarita]|uniref:39484_t:CDS:1 n=1 Tax=Gigaspora margarita TaxID=4874 RepID=A0ABN7VB92_GIGMA|nr:39484_t:CDS:2 [Gigaspora margarita]